MRLPALTRQTLPKEMQPPPKYHILLSEDRMHSRRDCEGFITFGIIFKSLLCTGTVKVLHPLSFLGVEQHSESVILIPTLQLSGLPGSQRVVTGVEQAWAPGALQFHFFWLLGCYWYHQYSRRSLQPSIDAKSQLQGEWPPPR